MSNTIQIKRSSTAAAVPTAGSLAQGELAVNLADRKLYTKNASDAVVQLNPVLDGFRNRIINGDMRIDQRNAGASVTASGVYAVDRFTSFLSYTSNLTFQQNAGSVTPPPGFTNYLGITTGTGRTVGSSDQGLWFQSIEGNNISDLGWGTANAQTVTLSFWVRSSLTGTHSGSLLNNGEARSYVFQFTISAANTWEYKTITIPGDTSGTWLTNNGKGIVVSFNVGSGSTLLTTAGSWNSAGRYGATGSVQLCATSGATFYITGVQLEAGSVATPFERRPYGTELALCQRYFYKIETANTVCGSGVAYNSFNIYDSTPVELPTTMRTSPTMTTGTNSFTAHDGMGTIIGPFTPSFATTFSSSFRLSPQNISGLTTGRMYFFTGVSGSSVSASAEL